MLGRAAGRSFQRAPVKDRVILFLKCSGRFWLPDSRRFYEVRLSWSVCGQGYSFLEFGRYDVSRKAMLINNLSQQDTRVSIRA
jgi:hypothetical protein